MIVGVLCYSYLSCGRSFIQTRVNTGPQSPQLLHFMFITVMEVSIKTGSKTTQVKKRKKQIIKNGLVVSIIIEHETAKWEITGLDTHQSMNKRDVLLALLQPWSDNLNDWTNVAAIFRSHGFEPLPVKHSKMSEVSRNCGDRPFISIFRSLSVSVTAKCLL